MAGLQSKIFEAMAETGQSGTCSLCRDLFRNPVTLPSGQTCCRECLAKFVETAPSVQLDETMTLSETGQSVTSNRSDDSMTVTEEDENVTSGCSICEEDNVTSPAVTFCPVCGVLYCESCLSSCHPLKGPLKTHGLKTVEEYRAIKAIPCCEKHDQPFSLFCVTCEEPICNMQCLEQHNRHTMSSIEAASTEIKARTKESTQSCQELRGQLKECGEKNQILKAKLQEIEANHIKETRENYTSAMTAVENWRENSENEVKKRYGDGKVKCEKAEKVIKTMIREMDGIIATFNGPDVVVVKGSKLLTSWNNSKLLATKEKTRDLTEQGNQLESALTTDIFIPKRLCVQEVDALLEVKKLNTSVEKVDAETSTHVETVDMETCTPVHQQPVNWASKRTPQGVVNDPGYNGQNMRIVLYIKTSLDVEVPYRQFLNDTTKAMSKDGIHLDVVINSFSGDDFNAERAGAISVLVCPITSRLGSSVDSAMRRASCIGHSRMVLLLCHHQPPHNPLAVESDRLLTEPKYSDIGCKVDVVFWQTSGAYPCSTNEASKRKLMKFIRRNACS